MKTLEENFSPVNTIWKTIEIGDQVNVDTLVKALKKKDCKISDWAEQILNKPSFVLTQKKEKAHLVLISVGELGFPNGATLKSICKAAFNIGLELCPTEVGPQILLQCPEQLKEDNWLRIASNPMIDRVGDPDVFRVAYSQKDGFKLDAVTAYTQEFFPCDYQWVFYVDIRNAT